MKITQKELSELSSTEVEEIMSFLDSTFSTVFHEPHFNKVVSEIFGTEFSYRLVYNSNGELIALCPLHSVRNGLLNMMYSNPAFCEVPYGGWVYKRNEISLDVLIGSMKLLFCEAFTYWSIPQIDKNDYAFIENKKEYQTAIIDLTSSIDDILYEYVSKNTRHNIRRAPRKGIVIEELKQYDLNIFIDLCNHLKKSVGLRIHASDFYIKLFQEYYPKQKMSVFAARLRNDYLSSLVTIGNKHVMHAWVAGRAQEIPKNVYQNELLWWNTVKWAKEKGSKYYDLCVVEPKRLPNIARFKLGFSKKIKPFYHISKKTIAHRILSKIRKCF